MVLRGTKTRPEQADLLDIQKHIARLRLLIDSLEDQEHDVEQEISNILHTKPNEPISIEQLKTGTAEIEIPSTTSSPFWRHA